MNVLGAMEKARCGKEPKDGYLVITVAEPDLLDGNTKQCQTVDRNIGVALKIREPFYAARFSYFKTLIYL
jgi:hypothetical protein